MNKQSPTQGRREIATPLVLTGLCGASIFFYFLFLGGTWFLAFLGMLAVLFLVGVCNYLIWGKHRAKDVNYEMGQLIDPNEAWMVHSEDSCSYRDSPYPPAEDVRRLDDLPPAIRKRLRGSLPFRQGNEDSRNNRNWWE